MFTTLRDFFYKIYFKYIHKPESDPLKKNRITDKFFNKNKIIKLLKDLEISTIKEGIVYGSAKQYYRQNHNETTDNIKTLFKGYPLVVIDDDDTIFKVTRDSMLKYRNNSSKSALNMLSAIDRVDVHITQDKSNAYFFIRTDKYDYYCNNDRTIGSVPTKDLIKAGFSIIYEKENCKETS